MITKILIRSFCKKARKFILFLSKVTLELLKTWAVGMKVIFRFFRFENILIIFLASIPFTVLTLILVDFAFEDSNTKQGKETIDKEEVHRVFDKKPTINKKEYIKRKARSGEII